MGCILWGFGKNWPRYKGTALCMWVHGNVCCKELGYVLLQLLVYLFGTWRIHNSCFGVFTDDSSIHSEHFDTLLTRCWKVLKCIRVLKILHKRQKDVGCNAGFSVDMSFLFEEKIICKMQCKCLDEFSISIGLGLVYFSAWMSIVKR